MGTVARTGIAGLVMGNTAERVLQRLRGSVLAVKPAGFRTPVAKVSGFARTRGLCVWLSRRQGNPDDWPRGRITSSGRCDASAIAQAKRLGERSSG
jgi:hypothetical protein